MVDGKTQVRLASTVTLEVTPKLAEKIAVAETIGSISLSLRSIADNSADLEHALAATNVKLPTGASKADEERLLKAAMDKPMETGTSFTTGGDVSRFQSRSVARPGAANASAMRSAVSAFGSSMAGALGSVFGGIGGGGNGGGSGGIDAGAGGMGGMGSLIRARRGRIVVIEAPTVRVTRGKSTETVQVGGN
jgi:pilus assembly protein CpaB